MHRIVLFHLRTRPVPVNEKCVSFFYPEDRIINRYRRRLQRVNNVGNLRRTITAEQRTGLYRKDRSDQDRDNRD